METKLVREEVVYCDFITVTSSDGSFAKNTLNLSSWYMKEGKDEEDKKFWARQRKCAQATLDAYKEGSLDEKYTSLQLPDEDKTDAYLNICIKATDVPDQLWDTLKECGQLSPCIYSGCYPMANMQMLTYRSNCGCVGRSWEITMVVHLVNESVYRIHAVKEKFGAYAAGLYILKIYCNDVDERIAEIEGLAEFIKKLDEKAS